jgi:hypothetical protein
MRSGLDELLIAAKQEGCVVQWRPTPAPTGTFIVRKPEHRQDPPFVALRTGRCIARAWKPRAAVRMMRERSAA